MTTRTLRDYAEHKQSCAVRDGHWVGRESCNDFGASIVDEEWVLDGKPCSCGLAALLAAPASAPEPPAETPEQRASLSKKGQ